MKTFFCITAIALLSLLVFGLGFVLLLGNHYGNDMAVLGEYLAQMFIMGLSIKGIIKVNEIWKG